MLVFFVVHFGTRKAPSNYNCFKTLKKLNYNFEKLDSHSYRLLVQGPGKQNVKIEHLRTISQEDIKAIR